MNEDLAFFLGISAVIVAVALAVYIGKSQQRACIAQHGNWKNDACQFESKK